jgi:hypothetical protein
MLPVEHDLNAIRPAAKIAVGQMTEVLADTLGWNFSLLRGGRLTGSRR